MIGCSLKRKEISVKVWNGNLLTKNNDVKNRWKEPFETVLNRQIPPDEKIPVAERDLDMDVGILRLEEVQKALKLKNNKGTDEDGTNPKMFKVDEYKRKGVLTKLFNRIWQLGKYLVTGNKA